MGAWLLGTTAIQQLTLNLAKEGESNQVRMSKAISTMSGTARMIGGWKPEGKEFAERDVAQAAFIFPVLIELGLVFVREASCLPDSQLLILVVEDAFRNTISNHLTTLTFSHCIAFDGITDKTTFDQTGGGSGAT